MAIESIFGTTINNSNNSTLPAKSVAKDAVGVKQNTSVPATPDSINFTNIAKDIKTAVATGATPPVVNEERVAAVKIALQSGNYKPDVERVAEKMLKFEDKLPNST